MQQVLTKVTVWEPSLDTKARGAIRLYCSSYARFVYRDRRSTCGMALLVQCTMLQVLATRRLLTLRTLAAINTVTDISETTAGTGGLDDQWKWGASVSACIRDDDSLQWTESMLISMSGTVPFRPLWADESCNWFESVHVPGLVQSSFLICRWLAQ